MALKHRKIRKKHRGTRTCGKGKKGSRRKGGGKGLSGSKKHKKTLILKDMPDHFGRIGFSRRKEKTRYVTLAELSRYVKDNKVKEIDVGELGYNKVLGNGELEVALTIKAKSFTKRAIEKIEKAGGKAVKV